MVSGCELKNIPATKAYFSDSELLKIVQLGMHPLWKVNVYIEQAKMSSRTFLFEIVSPQILNKLTLKTSLLLVKKLEINNILWKDYQYQYESVAQCFLKKKPSYLHFEVSEDINGPIFPL